MKGVANFLSPTPSESQARATPCEAAAPAVRPPSSQRSRAHRGHRSLAAVAYRRVLWMSRLDSRTRENSSGACSAGETTEPVHDDSRRFSSHDLEEDVPSDAIPRVMPPKGATIDTSFPSPASPAAREPRHLGLDACSFTFLLANVQGIFSKSAEVAHLVDRCNHPQIVGFTETFLDPSKPFSLQGYVQIARLDRRTGETQGGIILFARLGFENSIVHVGDSKTHERSWFVVHTDRGAVLLALWYRRPAKGEVESIEDLYDELSEFAGNTIHTIVMGDMNVHEASWLRFSDGTSEEGRALHTLSHVTGLEEKVGAPTRGDNLLDLVLSDIAGDLKCAVKSGVSDHEAVVGSVSFGLPLEHTVERELFDYKSAPWQAINTDLRERNWDSELSNLGTDDAASHVTRAIMDTLRKHVRHKKSKVRVSTHPWLNDRCREAIDKRIAARGTASETVARDECAQVLHEEYLKYVERTKKKLGKLSSSSSKQWWKLSNSLQGRGKSGHGVQPLQRDDGTWARTAEDKAELLSETFLSKSTLPAESINDFSALPPGPAPAPDTFLSVRTRDVQRQLNKLKEDSATGPDEVATQVLKKCSGSLARPLALVIRQMLAEGRWPACWRFHHIVPLYKKKAKSDPKNYRGVHLTSQISKAVERVVGRLFLPKLQAAGVFGSKQFAYSTGRSHLDALALSALSWLLSLERGNLVGF